MKPVLEAVSEPVLAAPSGRRAQVMKPVLVKAGRSLDGRAPLVCGGADRADGVQTADAGTMNVSRSAR